MAITKNSMTTSTFGWAVNGQTANASDCEELVAAPGSGKNLYLTDLSIVCAVKDMTVTIGEGETTNAVTTVLIGPVPFVNEATAAGYIPAIQHTWHFQKPIQLTADQSLTVDASVAGQIQVYVAGYTK